MLVNSIPDARSFLRIWSASKRSLLAAPSNAPAASAAQSARSLATIRPGVLARKPVEYFVRVIKREKRACARCIQLGVSIAASPVRIAPKSIFSDEMIIDFLVGKYCDSLAIYRQCATLKRDLGIEISRSTINDGVLRVGELLIPILAEMKRDLLAGNYIQADETPIVVQTPGQAWLDTSRLLLAIQRTG